MRVLNWAVQGLLRTAAGEGKYRLAILATPMPTHPSNHLFVHLSSIHYPQSYDTLGSSALRRPERRFYNTVSCAGGQAAGQVGWVQSLLT